MTKTFKAVAGAALAASLCSAGAADLVGKITLKGTPSAEKELPLDPACGKLWPNEKPKTRFYVVGPEKGLGDVFVYLKGADLKGDAPSKAALLDQKNCEYVPYVMGMQVGQKMIIRNSDPFLHNVHATPKVKTPQLNKEFNLAQMAGGKDLEKVLDDPEVFVRFKCDVHPWMFAYVAVLPHPYFAVTDKDGNYKISGVPAGKYTLVAYHRKTHVTDDKAQTQEINVGTDTVTSNFTVEALAQ